MRACLSRLCTGSLTLAVGLGLLLWLLPASQAGADSGTIGSVAPAGMPGPAADHGGLVDQSFQSLATMPRWSGPLLIIVGLIVLFAGWTLMRWSTALVAAGMAGGAVLGVFLAHEDPTMVWCAAAAVAVLAGVLGFFFCQALVAIQVAAVAAALGCILAELAMPHTLLTPILGVLGLVLGLVAGWRLAPYLGIAVSLLYGAVLIIHGMAILCRVATPREFLILSGVTALVSIPLGAFHQLRTLKTP